MSDDKEQLPITLRNPSITQFVEPLGMPVEYSPRESITLNSRVPRLLIDRISAVGGDFRQIKKREMLNALLDKILEGGENFELEVRFSEGEMRDPLSEVDGENDVLITLTAFVRWD